MNESAPQQPDRREYMRNYMAARRKQKSTCPITVEVSPDEYEYLCEVRSSWRGPHEHAFKRMLLLGAIFGMNAGCARGRKSKRRQSVSA